MCREYYRSYIFITLSWFVIVPFLIYFGLVNNTCHNLYLDIIIDVDTGGVILVLQLLTLLHTSAADFDGGGGGGGGEGSINAGIHDGLSASGSGFIAGSITDDDRLVGIILPIECWSSPFSKQFCELYSPCCVIVLIVPSIKIVIVQNISTVHTLLYLKRKPYFCEYLTIVWNQTMNEM